MAIRIVLADDHPIVLHGLRTLFERQSDIEVVAACTDGSAALEAVRTLRPDVLVVDLKMPGLGGLDIVGTVVAEQPECRCVLLTAAISEPEIVEAMRRGVFGLALKESPPDSLVSGIRRVQLGQHWIDQDMVLRAFRNVLDREADVPAPRETLTQRELEILRMVAEGLRNKSIADRLGISEGTVKVHLHNIYEKLGVNGRVDLLVSARQRGLL